MIILKLKEDIVYDRSQFNISDCDSCPFCHAVQTYDEYGYMGEFYCGLTNENLLKKQDTDKFIYFESRSESCPIISIGLVDEVGA